MFVGRRIFPPDLHDDNRRTPDIATYITMIDRGSYIAVMSTATLIKMRTSKTLQAPPWSYHPIIYNDVGKVGIPPNGPKDVKEDYHPIVDNGVGKVGILPNDPKVVKADYHPIADNTVGKDGNLPITLTHSDVGPRTSPHTRKDGINNGALPGVGLRRAGQVHSPHLRLQRQDPWSFPGSAGRGIRLSFSAPECFSGSASREPRKTTNPVRRPGSRTCPDAAYRDMLWLYTQLQDFRPNWFQNWILANILSKIQAEDRSSPAFSGVTSIYS